MSEYSWRDTPVCPYCNWSTGDSCEWHELGIDSEQDAESEIQCPNCEKKFHVTTHVTWNFSTVGISCKRHKLKEKSRHILKDGSEPIRYQCTECKKEIYNWSLEGGKYQEYTKDQYEILEK